MSKWKDEGDYWTMKYESHDKNPIKVRISIKKGTINIKKLLSTKQGKTNDKSGE